MLAVIVLVSLSIFRCAALKFLRRSSRGTLKRGASSMS